MKLLDDTLRGFSRVWVSSCLLLTSSLLQHEGGKISLTFSEKEVGAQHGGTCFKGETRAAQFPMCAHLTLQGILREVTEPADVQSAKEALIKQRPELAGWFHGPHNFRPWRMEEVRGIYLIDHFGGAPLVSVKDYFTAQPHAPSSQLQPMLVE